MPVGIRDDLHPIAVRFFAAIHTALSNIGYDKGIVIEAISEATLSDLAVSRARLHGMGWRFKQS